MRLVNGRGQLGEALASLDVPADVIVYHTWNCTDKSEAAQRACYERFVAFREDNPGRLVFISTSTENDSPYLTYKRKAEPLADGVVRLPTLIGRGICERFRDDPETRAWGTIELTAVDAAAMLVAAYLINNGTGVFTMHGARVPAFMVKDLIRFGAAR